MSLVRNEQAKLTANWLNAIAAGIIVTGVVAPVVAALYGIPVPSQASAGTLAFLSLIRLTTGTVLHWLARRLLTGLRV